MKSKINILALLVIGVFITIGLVISCAGPTSSSSDGRGACSGHDGVNCAAGPDSDGSVICNDGWEDSSVDYDDVCN